MQQEREKNRELIERFPFLLPDAGRDENEDQHVDFDYGFTELDFMPHGWRISLGERMCEEIRNTLLSSGATKEDGVAALAAYRVIDIKEKYGQLDWTDTGGVEEVIRKYEKLSSSVCILCGKSGANQKNRYKCPLCESCAMNVRHGFFIPLSRSI